MAAVAPKTDGGHNLGTADLRWGTVYTGNVNASGNVTISGNLSIIGNASEINVDNLSVAEPLIKLADGNTADTLDIGIYAQYNVGNTQAAEDNRYSVLYRDHDDGKWKLATGLTTKPEPGSDIDLTGLTTTTLVVDVLESNVLTGTDLNGDVTVTPNGTGHVLLVTDTVCFGETGDESVSLITPTNVDLVVRTGDPEADTPDNSGSITINAGDNGNIDITPHGTGEVNISKVDIDGGNIDGTVIGATTVAAGNFSDAVANNITASTLLTAASVDLNGGNIDGTVIGATTVAAGNFSDAVANNITASTLLTAASVDLNGGNIDGTAIGATQASTGKFTNVELSGTLDIGNQGNITISRSNNAALTIRSSDSSTNYVIIDTQDDDAGLNVFGKLNLTKGLQLGVSTPSDNTQLDITRSVVLLGDNIDVTLPAAADHTGRQFIVIVTGTSVTIDHANGTDAIYHNGAEQVSGGAWSLSQHDTYTFVSSGSAWYSV